MCVNAQVSIVFGLGRGVDKLLIFIADTDLIFLLRSSRYWQGRGSCRLGRHCLTCPINLSVLRPLVLSIKVLRLWETVLEKGGSAGAFQSAKSPMARLAGVCRKGGRSRGVVNSEVVLVPVTAVFAQPGCL